jgi:hypothetical protein
MFDILASLIGLGAGLWSRDQQQNYSQLAAYQQFERQKQLMDIQHSNQMALNRQGHELQMDMWNKTGYEAQVQQLKNAGLNPGLLYGKGGPGGTTGSQTGGSAAMGSVGQAPMIDIKAIEYMKTFAEINLLKSQAKKNEAEAEYTQGAKTAETESVTELNTANTANLKNTYNLITSQIATENAKSLNIEADTELKELDTYIKDATKDIEIKKVNEYLKNITQTNDKLAIDILMSEKELSKKEQLLNQLVEQNNLNIALTTLQAEAVKHNIKLTDAQINKMREEIKQGWKKISQEGEQIDINEVNSQLIKRGQDITSKDTQRGQTMNYNASIFHGRVQERGQTMDFRMKKYQADKHAEVMEEVAHINGQYYVSGKLIDGITNLSRSFK